ncbi:hypothetical protein V5799_025518 [Amblyomma americanum]|uniref:Uncharacterized protein n=1 Tax=Amblyomma americanum TaxID=6943 RepID=A0AAQ4E9G0_AMBAM
MLLIYSSAFLDLLAQLPLQRSVQPLVEISVYSRHSLQRPSRSQSKPDPNPHGMRRRRVRCTTFARC